MKKRWLWLLPVLCLALTVCGLRLAAAPDAEARSSTVLRGDLSRLLQKTPGGHIRLVWRKRETKLPNEAMLEKLEACDAAVSVWYGPDALYQKTCCVYAEHDGGRTVVYWEQVKEPYLPVTAEADVCLECLVMEDYFGNLSGYGKDLRSEDYRYIRIYISAEELRSEALAAWLRSYRGRAALCLNVMEDPPEWVQADGEQTVFRLTAPDSVYPENSLNPLNVYYRLDGTEIEAQVTKGLRKYAEKRAKPALYDAAWQIHPREYYPKGYFEFD